MYGKWKWITYILKLYCVMVNAVHYEIYIPSLKMGQKKQYITCKIIHDYIMKKPPGEIWYMLFHTKEK